MTRAIVFVLCLTASISVSAQLYESAFHVGWNIVTPITDKDFTSKPSTSGVRIGFSKFINERFGFGVEGSYNTLDDYVPLKVYQHSDGAISTDVYNYLYYFTVLANAQYYFMQGSKFIPYASLGMGMSFNEYRVFYNIYEESDSRQGFLIRPEVGTLFRIKEYSHWGFKSSLSYEYTTNKSEFFGVDNFSGISFQLGVVLFTE